MRKRLVLLSALIGLILMGFTVKAGDKPGYDLNFNQSRSDQFSLDISLDKYQVQTVSKNGESYSDIDFPGKVVTKKQGWAEVPYFGIPVQLPATRNVDVEITSIQYEEIELDHPLLPSRGVIYRNQDPDDIPYQIDPASIVDEYYPENTLETSDPYIIRKVRGENIYVHPFQYNAVQQTLRVATSITISVSENTETPDNPLTISDRSKKNVEMLPVYKSMFVNFRQDQTRWAEEIDEFGDVLVIYTADYAAAIQPWITWKQQKGYNVDELEVSTGANVASDIQSAYDANNNLLYVLLVGDWADIKSDLGTNQNAPMDPMMGCVAGTDDYHDIIVGRFSAESPADVTAQVDKTIEYEKDATSGSTWYKNAQGIASDEGAGAGDDGEGDIEHINNIHDGRLLPTTYTTCHEEFDPGASATNVQNNIDNGVSVINYTGHGGQDYWVSSGYSTTEASSSTNGPKYYYAFSVACVVGAFHENGDCLAEAMARNPDGGSVANWMATINQPWTPPMRGQDYANDLLVQGYDYNSGFGSGTSTTYGRTTFGSITFNAAALMVAETSNDEDWDTYKTWTVFGDPSVQVRTDEPKDITLSNMSVTPGTYTTQVTVDGSGFEGAIVSLWQSGSQPASAVTDESGNVSIDHSFTGTVKLTVSGFNLASYSEDHVVAVPDPPVADFEADQTSITAGESVQFTDLSTNYPSTWSWTFEGGTPETSSEQNPVVTYNTAGTYDVTLYAENSAGDDTEIKTGYITVDPVTDPPVTDFIADQTVINIGETVNFTDLSTNLPDSWEWNFEGGTPATSTDQNPSVTYDTPGTYDVSLEAGNSYGADTETKSGYITVELPDYCDAGSNSTTYEYLSNVVLGTIDNDSDQTSYSDFTAMTTDAAPGDDLAFTATISNAYSSDHVLVWADWNRDGDFQDADESLFTSEEGEGPFSTTITVPASATPGPVRVRVRLEDNGSSPVNDPCGNSGYGEVEDYTIQIIDDTEPPVADFSGTPTSIMEGESVAFTDLSDHPESWSWDFGDGGESNEENPVYTYSTAGTYTVELTVTNTEGTDTETKVDYITVDANTNPPTADFEADQTSINTGATVNFTDLSTNNPDSWEWSFEGGTPNLSTDQNPSVTYDIPGTYTVSLTATNDYGDSTESKTDYITVTAAGFSMDFEDCADYSADFSPWSVYDGDGQTTYGSGDCDFPGENDTMSFMAFNPVDAGFDLADAHGGDRVGMAICPDDGSASDDWLISSQLSLGDNSSFSLWALSPKPGTWGNDEYEVLVSTATNDPADFTVISGADPVEAPDTWTEHTYDLSAYDNQDIYLAVRHVSADKFMLWIDDMVINTDWAVPFTADFVADNTDIAVNETVSFTDLSSDSATSWSWDFGDGSTSTEENPTHTYTAAGVYAVELTASDGSQSDTETKVDYITVTEQEPVADFTASPIESCDGTVQFTDASSHAESWNWDFDDGNTSTDENPEHTFADNGTYTVSLTVTNYAGSDTDTMTITVDMPDASITPLSTVCETDDPVSLSAATDGGSWSGTGVSGDEFDPALAGPGTHTISYEVSIGTCTDYDTETITVDTMPDATIIDPGTFCTGDATVTLSAVDEGGTWSGTGVTGDQFDPVSAGVGTHTITYEITNGACTATDQIELYVSDQFDATIDPVSALCNTDAPVELTAADEGGTWSGTGVSNGNFDPDLAGPGDHEVSYLISGSCGDSDMITIHVDSMPDATIDTLASLCEGDDPVTLTAATEGGTWSGNGVSGDQFDPQEAGAGTHNIVYEISNGACTTFESIDIVVDLEPDASIDDPGSFCLSDESYTLTAATSGGTWSGPGVSENLFDPQAAGTGTHTISYEVQNGNCTASDVIEIVVGETPTVDLDIVHATSATAEDGSASATVSGGLEPYTFNWSTGSTESYEENLAPGLYSLVVFDAAGCSVTVPVEIDYPDMLSDETSLCLVYPNPADQKVFIEMKGLQADKIELVNALGQTLREVHVQSDLEYLELSDIQTGVYFLRIHSGDTQRMHKVLIQH
ncbi:MAG: PKD domain-containing protein [Bacteroidales bacterium]